MSDLHLRFNGHTKRDNAMQRLLGGICHGVRIKKD